MITGAEVTAALEDTRVIRGLLADPDLTRRQLLFAIAFQVEGLGRDHTRTRTWLAGVAEVTGMSQDSIRFLIADDVPRYKPELRDARCEAPMIRRAGVCGQRANHQAADVDPATGDRWMIGRCTRHEAPTFWAPRAAHWSQWEANGKPSPPHNTGGLLARHFPGVDWPVLYAWAAPHVEQTPGTGKPATPKPPTLTLIRGGAQ